MRNYRPPELSESDDENDDYYGFSFGDEFNKKVKLSHN